MTNPDSENYLLVVLIVRNSLLKPRNLKKLAFTKREGWVESHRINLLEHWVEEAVKTKMFLLVVTHVLC